MCEPIHITVPASPRDPRSHVTLPGVIVHYVPELHPDDVDIVDGLRVTSVARTLIDCAQDASREELRGMFHRARDLGILDMDAVHASRSRVEWRPSLVILDQVIAEFDPHANSGPDEIL
jgi:hypothetical protein